MNEIKITLTEKEFIEIRKALGKEPYDTVQELIYKLSSQVQNQLKADKKE